MKNCDFVITSLQQWDITIGSNAKDIALEISKHNRVLFVNSPLDKKTFLSAENIPETIRRRNVISGKSPSLRQVNSNLWVLDCPFTIWPVNGLPDGRIFDFFNRLNNKKIYTYVRTILEQLKFKDYTLFIDNDIYRSFYAKELLDPAFCTYYRRDNLTTPYWERHAPRLEPLLCHKCDMVVANSLQLAEAVELYNEKVYDIGQGVDLGQYDIKKPPMRPKDMENIPSPIIGYIGWITSLRLDADLIYEMARRQSDCSFVMVGGEDNYFKEHNLHTLSNVYFLGEKAVNEVPTYIYSFDICMNPQKVNEMTIGNYPRKIDEYLAFGKPTIATATKTMELFNNYVWNCKNVEEYIEAIQDARQENSQEQVERRIQFAHTHTWANSVNKLYSHIKSHHNIVKGKAGLDNIHLKMEKK